jgi:hypothetical protein
MALDLTAHTLEIIQYGVLSVAFLFSATLLVNVVAHLVEKAFNVD